DPNLVAKPGFSEHETGFAFDLAVLNGDTRMDFTGEDEYSWIQENAHKFGFILRYNKDKVGLTGIAYEPWHYRYVGIPHATYMYENNLCLEEYTDFIKSYKYDDEHLYVKADGKTFEVYFVPSDPLAMITQVPVYTDTTYTVSGNNTDGYIITVDRGGNFTIPTETTAETVTAVETTSIVQ
ncbi:MAG: M15 family metallopeptidase, partial [Oscillospiraceae bacterium]|nr:M15 family metallopeptidase [Oscillospiraceae bacterium]